MTDEQSYSSQLSSTTGDATGGAVGSEQPFVAEAVVVEQSSAAEPTAAYAPPPTPQAAQPAAVNYTPEAAAPVMYPMTETDRTLRLIAFVFNIITTVCCAIFIIPLAWMIPMSVRSWGIYKGTKPNTVAFGVCDLLFVSLVSGILLLCSTKQEKMYQ